MSLTSRELSDCSQNKQEKYKEHFKSLGTEPLGNISIDRANSGVIKKGLINHGIKYRERVSGRLTSQVP